MSTPAILSQSTPVGQLPTSPLSSSKLNMQDFLNLMTQQLKNQDPLNPMSDSDFFAQMAQLGQVEGMDQLNNSSQMQQAQSLMGQVVSAMDTTSGASGSTQTMVTGVVNKVSSQNGTWMVGITKADGTIASVPVTSVQSAQAQQDLSQASNYIGHKVTANTTTLVNSQQQVTPVSGTVTGITIAAGSPSLTLKLSNGSTTSIDIGQITSVSS